MRNSHITASKTHHSHERKMGVIKSYTKTHNKK